MKIQFASDLHLEFYENSKYLKCNPLKPVGDILILAGDIECLNLDYFFNNSFWDYVSDNFKEVIVVAGNHEFYTSHDLAKIKGGKICAVRRNVNYYYNSLLNIGGVRLIVSPLWSYIPVEQAAFVKNGVSDFHRISYNNSKLTIDEFNREHERCLNFIKRSVNESAKENSGPIVVVTHHVPSFELSSPDYAGSRISGAFTTELANYIEASPIDYWIYGHSHRNIDKIIGNTKCVSNQLGYVFYEEHHSFENDKVIEV